MARKRQEWVCLTRKECLRCLYLTLCCPQNPAPGAPEIPCTTAPDNVNNPEDDHFLNRAHCEPETSDYHHVADRNLGDRKQPKNRVDDFHEERDERVLRAFVSSRSERTGLVNTCSSSNCSRHVAKEVWWSGLPCSHWRF